MWPSDLTIEGIAQELVDAMETCHACSGTVLVDEEMIHCEDCPSGCEHHDPPDCPTLYDLHLRLKNALKSERALKQPRLTREQAANIYEGLRWADPETALPYFITRLQQLGITVEPDTPEVQR